MAAHTACRSCHAPNADPESEAFDADCAFCHQVGGSSASLAQLIPPGRVALAFRFVDGEGRPVSDEDVDAWRRELVVGLHDEGVNAAPAEGQGAAPLEVEIRRVEGAGSTDSGTTYVAVRYDAVLRVRRAETTVRGRPFVAADAARRDEARAELIARIVPVVAY